MATSPCTTPPTLPRPAPPPAPPRRARTADGPGDGDRPERSEDTEGDEALRRFLLCAACRLPVAAQDARMPVDGSHEHSFENPDGVVFHIGCFAAAAGCREIGPRTSLWTWFEGFSWQIALCRRCGTHLGWRFRRQAAGFYGLILARLAEPDDEEEHG